MTSEQDMINHQNQILPCGNTLDKYMGDELIKSWKDNGQRTYIIMDHHFTEKPELIEVKVQRLSSGKAHVMTIDRPYQIITRVKQEDVLVEMKGVCYE